VYIDVVIVTVGVNKLILT